MSKQSTSFEIGFALGSVVREFRRALSRPPVVVQAQAPVASSVQRIEADPHLPPTLPGNHPAGWFSGIHRGKPWGPQNFPQSQKIYARLEPRR
ncbi:TPA: hypothetical protein L5693_006452 [Pseudomonas aeruginosa]|nr:hypothetical protein [Pseudomonas aeruginosa]HBP5493618.1 hypothetical protein [Pseudomonas aeruginosa]